jgi:large subunit ribosomal protein L10
MLTRKNKEQIVKDLTEQIKSAKSVVFADFKGVKVNESSKLKKELKKEGSNLSVYKKNLIDIALKNVGVDLKTKGMEGQIAVSISSQDEVSAAKIIDKFSKTNENLKMLGGLLGIKVMNAEEVSALAKLPSKDELLAKLVGSLSSPIRGLMNVFQGNQRSLVQVLKAISEKNN